MGVVRAKNSDYSKLKVKIQKIINSSKLHTPLAQAGVHLRGGRGGGAFAPPRRAPAPPRIQVSYIFLQSYYEMIKGIQHVHVL